MQDRIEFEAVVSWTMLQRAEIHEKTLVHPIGDSDAANWVSSFRSGIAAGTGGDRARSFNSDSDLID